MKCKKCGAEIPQGYVYCKVCGNEVQLVPDYNLLDDDILSDILQKEGKKEKRKKKISSSKIHFFIWGSIVVVLLIAVCTLFFVFREIQYRHVNNYDYQYQKAEAYFKEKDYENALLHYQKALELQPKDKKAQKKLLEIYLETGKTDEAVLILEELIAEDNSDKDSIQSLIEIYDKEEEYDKILALCEKIENSDLLDLFADYLVEQPKFNYISGTYPNPISVSISSAKEYDIFYTTDGTDPVSNGKLYRSKIFLEEEGTTIIMAVAKNEKGICSERAQEDYTIKYEPPEMPKVTPYGGVYEEPQMIQIDVPSNCVAYYTWDGSDPTEHSFRYTAPLEMPLGNQVLSVILINTSGLKSSIYRVNYVYMP